MRWTTEQHERQIYRLRADRFACLHGHELEQAAGERILFGQSFRQFLELQLRISQWFLGRRGAQVKTVEHSSSGKHLIADLYGIEPEKLTDPAQIEHLLKHSATAAGACVIYSRFHTFGPGQGVTGVVLLAESHISIHTWPESGFAAADVFMCGNAEPERAMDLIVAALSPASTEILRIGRGEPRSCFGRTPHHF
jgi:S-adenosylmethionine decarboxylase